MGQAEYIVRFKGDYSALQKDINKIAGETKKLSDDEVIIKLAYDGNIKEFNKVFNQISEMHPELGIQFQYNVNQKILEQETDKLKKLTDIKIDVDENKAQKKLENLADYVETALMDGLSKDEINKRVRDVFGYYNTAIKAGAKNIDFGSIRNRLLDSFSIESDEIADIYAEIADRNINKPIELFKINTSINDEITKTTDRINDLQESLKYLEGKGASKTGLPTELEKVQDEIKILRADVDEMKQDLNSLTGEAFDKMTESIKETNVQLSEAIDKIKILSVAGVSDNKVSSLKTLMSLFSDFAKSNNSNNLSSFWDNLQVKINSGDDELKTLLSDLKLINAETGKLNIIEHGNVKSGGLLSDEYTLLATKRATQDTDFTVSSRLEDTIVLKQKLDEAADAGVNVSRILNIIYDEASDTFFELQETAKGDILGGMGEAEINTRVFEATDEQIQKLISDILYLNNIGVGIDFHGLNVLYDKIKGFSIIDTDIVPEYNFKDNWEDFTNDIIGGLNFSFEDSSGKMSEEAQGFVKRVQGVLANIDTSEIKSSAKEVIENAANALQEAQNKSSSAELTKPLGKDFGLGYAEGIREAMPEIVEACKEIVLAAYDAVKEASDAKNGEGNNFLDNFINNLKESLDNAAPTIQEKIKEVFSKINIDNISEKSSLSSISSEDFQSQFQNAIDKTGEYIIKVYGELIDDFKSRLQNSIDETGIYHVDIEGWLYDTFHDGLQRDIDGQEKYIIEVKGRLFDSFKEVLQEAIENLGAFPIQVKPYMRKGEEIEEVDLPKADGNNFSSEIEDEIEKQNRLQNELDETFNKFKELKLYHGSNKDFDKFDSSMMSDESLFGKGAYFTFNEEDAQTYGYQVSQWFANINKVYEEESKLSEEELKQIFDEYNKQIKYIWGDNFSLDDFINEIKNDKNSLKTIAEDIIDSSEEEVLKKFNYQARIFDLIESQNGGKGIVVFDVDNLERADKLLNETPVSNESTEAETKALLSKKEVVEQLRTELNLTKKVAEDLFDQQGYAKTNNKYQIEQTAVDELIASLKEKKQVEESQDSFTTSPTANAMQSEVEAVNQAIDAEKKKFDELKNKISKTIPAAINKKNQAFEKERDLVAKVVDDEVDYFDVLKDSINSVTNTIEKQYDTTKNAKPKADKSNNKSSSNKSNEPDKDALLQQHYVDLRKDTYQSFGQKSDIQKEMSKYYSQLEKESSDIYSSANKKANGLLDKIKKLNFD
ncbi:hypothetical protein SAMN05660484_02596 [Eubacterium ruminantium]|uniref:ART-PolyVal-like domain-containing protein n=1 Tax=Eubacterium ruminantium TaxID=42322 RepID=A0A1T4QWV3_9FIRM|nr:hypothetical protein [Eubacterium ruminantium]SCW70286.1 hypothetical protein SAMN05660484_02596 [Eubacterium ruminantium]SDN46854.1 hypothetical protein SAMN04490370_1272 [Eubacterium ruminantium]SKA07798.1 hypothetical protein SAMN02745110_02538 [Eubacterium ruminantium]